MLKERLQRLEKLGENNFVKAVLVLAALGAGSTYINSVIDDAQNNQDKDQVVQKREDSCGQLLQNPADRLAARLPRSEQDKVLPDMQKVLENGFLINQGQQCIDIINSTGGYVPWESNLEKPVSVVVLGHKERDADPHYDHDGTWVQGFLFEPDGEGVLVWIDMSSVDPTTFPFSFGERTGQLADFLGVETGNTE